MTFEEFIGIRRCDEDVETGRKMSHREIYARAIERFGGLDVVWNYVPYKDVAWLQEKAAEDPFFNNTDMTPWDFASGFICYKGDVKCTGSGLWRLYRQHGITSASNAQGVAMLKEAARLMCEREGSDPICLR